MRLVEKKQILGVEKMGVGKTNIDLDGQLTNFPGQTQRVEAQGLAQLGTTNGSIRLGTT